MAAVSSSDSTAIRSLFLREFMRRFRAAPLPGIAALLRRARRLFRLRHGAPHRDASRRARARRRGRPRRSSRHAAAAHRRARGDRQPVRTHLPDRLRRSRSGRTRTRAAQDRLQELRRKLREPVTIPYQTASAVTRPESESGADAYQAAVRRAKEYIAAGDIMQVVLSQRLRLPFTDSPLSLYRALRSRQSVAVHVLLRLRRLPRRRRIAGDPRAQGGIGSDVAPDRGHAPARRDARSGRASRVGARRRSEGNRRARDAARPRAATMWAGSPPSAACA